MTAFKYKGYGRIYTFPKYILQVESLIKELDEFEWSYYPEGLVVDFDRYPNVIYIGKFELNLEKFKEECDKRRLPVFVFNSEDNDEPCGAYKLITKDDLKNDLYNTHHDFVMRTK